MNTFNIDLDTTIPSSPSQSLLTSDSEKKMILEIEAQLLKLKGYMYCQLSILSSKTDFFTARLKTPLISFEN